jgi:GMP synthase (glutamine-hydrolysing)
LDKSEINSYIERTVDDLRKTVGSKRVLLALSGGVDSSVCAALLSKALPCQTVCVYVDHGFMRLSESDEIENTFSKLNVQLIRVNAQERFLRAVKNIRDPENKRKRIGAEFIAVFEEEARKLGNIPFLAQGTIRSDVVESGTGTLEPLSGLYKDAVRAVGIQLGLPPALVRRQPFPGPGLAIRVMGTVTKRKLDILRAADAVVRDEIDKSPFNPDQYFAVFTGIRSVGVGSSGRRYGYVIAVRAVESRDFMTGETVPLPHELLTQIANRLIQEVNSVGRVVYDITGKPPGTVEWE